MGKSAKFKKLRKIAANLPELLTNHKENVKVQGEDLIKRGHVNLTDGTPIKPGLTYHSYQYVQRPANYNKYLKDRYNHGGINAALQFASSVMQRAEELKKPTSVSEKVTMPPVDYENEKPGIYST